MVHVLLGLAVPHEVRVVLLLCLVIFPHPHLAVEDDEPQLDELIAAFHTVDAYDPAVLHSPGAKQDVPVLVLHACDGRPLHVHHLLLDVVVDVAVGEGAVGEVKVHIKGPGVRFLPEVYHGPLHAVLANAKHDLLGLVAAPVLTVDLSLPAPNTAWPVYTLGSHTNPGTDV